MPKIRTATSLTKRLLQSPPKVEARLDEMFMLITGIDRLVAEINQQLQQVVGVVGTQGELRSELNASYTAQIEALTFLNRSLRELSERVAVLESASPS